MRRLMRPFVVPSLAVLSALAGCNLVGGPNYFVDEDFDAASSGAGGRGASSSSEVTSTTASTATMSDSASSTASSASGAACIQADCESKDAADDCYYAACVNDACDNMLIVKKDAACSANGGKVCDGAGACVECTGDGQCTNGKKCLANYCQGSSCSDKVKNGAEVGVDCGGPDSGCAPCVNGTSCMQATDCASKVCKSGTCQVCTDLADCSAVPNHYCSFAGGLVCTAKKGKSSLCVFNDECLSGTCNVPFCG